MNLYQNIQKELAELFTLQKSNRDWRIPILIAVCVGTPLMTGYFLNSLQNGLLACIGGLVILYYPTSGTLTNRIITMLVSSFGFMVSFTIGQLFSFNQLVSIIALGVFSFAVHWIILSYKTSPPRSFFFIFIAALSISQPFNFETIPFKVGLIGLGTMLSSTLAILFILFLTKSDPQGKNSTEAKARSIDVWESVITGLFMAISLLAGQLFEFENTYWVSVSTIAVMQGATISKIWQRSFQRILGTFVGLALCWVILSFIHSPLWLCISIILLQLIVEFLISRHYALAVVFITPMAILLAEAATHSYSSPGELIQLRLWETVLGSIIGGIGGLLLYKEKLRFTTIHELRKLSGGIRKTSEK